MSEMAVFRQSTVESVARSLTEVTFQQEIESALNKRPDC